MYGADILMDVLGVSSPVDLLKKDKIKGDIYNSNEVSKLDMTICCSLVQGTSCTLTHLYIIILRAATDRFFVMRIGS